MKKIVLVALVLVAFAGPAWAADYQLTTLGSSVWINGALFTTNEVQPTGTGVIQPFLKFQSTPDDSAQAYNYAKINFGDVVGNDAYGSANWTHLLLTSELGVVMIGGTAYWQFMLDIDQTGASPYMSLDFLQFSTSDDATFHGAITGTNNLNTLTFPYLGTVFWDLGDNHLMLNYSLNSGSGSGDLYVYVPVPDTYDTYLYLANAMGFRATMFGEPTIENDGPEEWSALSGPGQIVPEPSSMLLLGIGLLGFARAARARRR